MRTAFVLLFVLCLTVPTLAAPTATLEYRFWLQQPQSWSVLELRQQSSPTRGFRLWGATGKDDCDYGSCFDNTFWGLDLTYRLRQSNHWAYVGYYNLARAVVYDESSQQMGHSGFRVGVLGAFSLTTHTSLVYDAAYLPFDQFRITNDGPNGTPSGQGNGITYRVGLRYTLSPSVYIEGGRWSMGFNLPACPTCTGAFRDHVWEGPYLTVGVSR